MDAETEKLERDVTEGLAMIGGAGIPFLIDAVRSDNRELSLCAASALRYVEDSWDIVLPALIAILEEMEGDVTYFAAQSLAGHGAKAAAAVPALLKLLRNQEIRDTLNSMLDHQDPKIQMAVKKSLDMLC